MWEPGKFCKDETANAIMNVAWALMHLARSVNYSDGAPSLAEEVRSGLNEIAHAIEDSNA